MGGVLVRGGAGGRMGGDGRLDDGVGDGVSGG